MTPELEQRFYAEFPDLLRQHTLSVMESCLAFGLEIGDGWGPLLRELLTNMKKYGTEHGIEIEITQVKEKFGELRVYFMLRTCSDGSCLDELEDMVDAASDKSREICELCGKSGKIRESSWLMARCAACAESGRGGA
jgi:hypothetical protein